MKNPTLRQLWTAVRALIVLTVILGVLYPVVVLGIGQLALPAQANGSLVRVDGRVVGSSLIGQSFDSSPADAAEWFQSRPSAAGEGYDGGASSGSNYGPSNPDLLGAIDERRIAIEQADHAEAADIPAEAVTESGSGLDPDISPAYALLQVDRVAAARGLTAADVERLVRQQIQGRDLGYLGEPTVNVLELNIALAKLGD